MNNYLLFAIIVGYLALLFFIAFLAERNSGSKWVNSPYVYTLSLAVYCSAWTYYGSVGIAAKSGVGFLTISLGPAIAAPLWIVVLRKVIRIARQHKVSSLADFISLRYGNHRFLGALITILCLVGTVPYIALQLKAVSETFEILAQQAPDQAVPIWFDSTLYIAVLLAVFATFFGTQTTDAAENHRGIVTSTAFESILKLVFFLIIGGYTTFYLFQGTTDIYERISQTPQFVELIGFPNLEAGFDWFFIIILSFFSVFLLPRMFQVAVLENTREKHLKQAIWLFPLYLLLFNIFVPYIAWGGKLLLGQGANADYFSLLLPLSKNHTLLATMVFLGGFSAVISMVVLSTLALANMVGNNLVIPYGFLDRFSQGDPQKNSFYIKNIRRASIFIIIIIAYLFYINFSVELSLYAIGLISFVIIAQLAPSFFIGLFWNRGSSKGAITGILFGSSVSFYTLILPFSLETFFGYDDFTQNGPFALALLKPYALFGLDILSPPAHAFFWSMMCNTLGYFTFSLTSKGNYRERNYAEMFVDPKNYATLQDSALIWKGEAYVSNIRNMLSKFLGERKTKHALEAFFIKYGLPKNTESADARLISFSEKLLTGSIGSASSKILIASVVKEEEISLSEVLKILEENKEAIARNRALNEKSAELFKMTQKLQKANEDLLAKDQQKDGFLDTVAHELKTPLTGIRAAMELLMDDEGEMPAALKAKFLSNSVQDLDRLSRLINTILEFEKLTHGKEPLNLQMHDFQKTLKKAIGITYHMAAKKEVEIINDHPAHFQLAYDEDKILQVLTNLLSNAIKFVPQGLGTVKVGYKLGNQELVVTIADNGRGIPQEDFSHIFEKFYQSKNQNIRKPEGSGLGLAICKQIIEKHGGRIWAKNGTKEGAVFGFTLPFK